MRALGHCSCALVALAFVGCGRAPAVEHTIAGQCAYRLGGIATFARTAYLTQQPSMNGKGTEVLFAATIEITAPGVAVDCDESPPSRAYAASAASIDPARCVARPVRAGERFEARGAITSEGRWLRQDAVRCILFRD